MSGTNGNTQSVEQSTHIKVVNVTYQERDNAALVRSLTEDTDIRNLFQTLHSISSQFMFMGGNIIHTKTCHIIKGFCQPGSTNVIGSTGFKLERKFIERCFLKRNVLYHFSPTLIRRQAVEPFFFSVKNTHTGRTIDFMCREGKEVSIHVLHINFHMRYGLCTVYQYRYPVGMSSSNHLFDGIHSSQYIGNLRYTHYLRPV